MAKFYVQHEVALHISVKIEADDLQDAIEKSKGVKITDLVSVKKGSKDDWNIYTRGAVADASIMNLE